MPNSLLPKATLEKIIVHSHQKSCRLDKYLTFKLTNTSRTTLQNNIKQGHITVNDKHVKPSHQIQPQDSITVKLPKQNFSQHILPENIPLNILYEDNHLLIVNKPATMVVHPACQNWSGTLINALQHHYQNLPVQPGYETRPGLVHRIDKGTSGLLVIAKTKYTLDQLSQQFREHTIERKYVALVWGKVQKDSDTISIPLTRNPKDRRIIQACQSTTLGKTATTHYRVLKRLENVTLIQCRLETGRTHQIRAHMKYLGHPLFGDTRYGGNQIIEGPQSATYRAFIHNCFKILPHQALHAQTLYLQHPITQQKKHFYAPLPTAFQKILNKWQRYTKAIETITN